MSAAMAAAASPELQAIAGFAQINLLEATVAVRQRALPWWSPLACAALLAAGAAGSSLHLNPQVAALKARAAKREAQVQEQTALIEAAARQHKGGSAKDQAQALQAALTQQERLLALLGGVSGTQGPGVAAPTAQDFSALLEGLSRTRVDGLWLTQVRLDRRTQEVRLEGQARQAQLVSSYIDDLSRNPRFKGLVLSAVEVTRPAARGVVGSEGPEPARFKLASAMAAPVPSGAVQPVASAPTGAKAGATP